MDKIDILNREKFVEQLVKLTENIANNKKSASFAIDGQWGCGKSFVLDLFEEKLCPEQSVESTDNKYLVIRYNCWKYDYYEEPLVAIVATILEAINKKTMLIYGEGKEKILGILKAVGASFLSISNSAIKTKTGIDFKAAFDVVKTGLETGKESYEKMNAYDGYFGFKQALHSLQQALNELSKEYTIVLLVDELDRCLPEYAIKVLERLHHLNENSRIINVIAIDKTQMINSIRRILGEADIERYLKKFIQFTVKLDLGSISEKIMDKYPGYIAMFDMDKTPFVDSVEEFLQMIFRGIDVREQERLVEKAAIVHTLLYKDKKDYTFMCMELLIVVINSCYGDNTLFTQKLKSLAIAGSNRNELPPFADDFDRKFKQLNSQEIYPTGVYIKDCIGYSPIKSLYSRILCVWHEMFIRNSNRQLVVADSKSRLVLDEHIKDLEDFYETVKLIK